jgi:hypothetical protein
MLERNRKPEDSSKNREDTFGTTVPGIKYTIHLRGAVCALDYDELENMMTSARTTTN